VIFLLKDIIKLQVNEKIIRDAILKASKNEFIDNLRDRRKAVKFDCKLRGYIGEISLFNWFLNNGIKINSTNTNYNDLSMDIDFLLETNGKKIDIELKTSLIPDYWLNLENCLIKGDIKIIKRTSKIEEEKADIHIQIYFGILRKMRDNYLRNIELSQSNIDEIYTKLNCSQYIDSTYFVAWIDKKSLVKYITSLPIGSRTWSFPQSFRDFWRCNITNIGKKPIELLNYIKGI